MSCSFFLIARVYCVNALAVYPRIPTSKPQCPYGLVDVPGSSRWDLMFRRSAREVTGGCPDVGQIGRIPVGIRGIRSRCCERYGQGEEQGR
jgi:hypothetical protein